MLETVFGTVVNMSITASVAIVLVLAARLLLRMADGTEHRAEVSTNRGDTEDPYGPDEVAAKFHELADPVWGAASAARLREAVSGLPGASSTVELDRLLTTEFTA